MNGYNSNRTPSIGNVGNRALASNMAVKNKLYDLDRKLKDKRKLASRIRVA